MQSPSAGPRWAALTALSLAVAAFSLAVPAYADGPGARGTVHDVQLPTPDRAYGILTLDTRLGPVAFNVTGDTHIEVEDHPAALADVHVGDAAKVEYLVTTSAFVATELEVERPRAELFGVVTNVVKNALDPNVVEVTIDPPTGDPMTLKATADTDVSVGDHEGINLAALTPEQLSMLKGGYAKAEYLVGTDQAAEIAFRKAGRLPFRGIIQGVDTTNNLLTVGAGDQHLSLVVVPNSTICRLNGKNVTLGELTPGDRCEGAFWMVPSQSPGGAASNVALVVKAQWPRPVEFSGTIANVTPVPAPAVASVRTSGGTGGGVVGTLGLTLRNGATYTVTLYGETRIKVNGKPATFADLQPGQKCHVLCIPRPDGKNPDGTDKTRFDCFRLEAQKPRPAQSEHH